VVQGLKIVLFIYFCGAVNGTQGLQARASFPWAEPPVAIMLTIPSYQAINFKLDFAKYSCVCVCVCVCVCACPHACTPQMPEAKCLKEIFDS
jgi:hypothetical protein